jgi:hypothetical protein
MIAGDGNGPEDLRPIIEGLKSNERDKRFEAIHSVERLPAVPPPLVDPLVSFLHLEAEGALLPETHNKNRPLKPITKVPLTGEELSLARLKADPTKCIGETFVLCGGIQNDDYYNFGFSDAVKTHYSFRFSPVTEDAKILPSVAHVYVNRLLGQGLSETVTQTEEKGGASLVRLRCTIPKDRAEGNEENALSMIEAKEWQFVNIEKNEWRPWTFDGIRFGCRQLLRVGKPAVPALASIVLRDQEYQNQIIDTLLRLSAMDSLVQMPDLARDHVAEALKATPRRQRTELANEWADMLAKSLGIVEEREAEPVPAKKAEIDPEIRASTMLRSAENLEKAKKIDGALKFYREIVAKYPKTKAAAQASRRIGAIFKD